MNYNGTDPPMLHRVSRLDSYDNPLDLPFVFHLMYGAYGTNQLLRLPDPYRALPDREDWPTAARSDGLEVYYHCSLGVYWHLIIFQVGRFPV